MNIYNRDCIEVMKEMKDSSIDMIITDPPYFMDYQSHRRKNLFDKIKNDKDEKHIITDFCKESYRILKENTAIYMFCSWHNVDFFKNEIEKYFKIKNILIWCKNNHGSGDLLAQYAPRYEMIIYANKGRCKFRNGRFDDVLFFDKVNGKDMLHPTQKPIDLLEFLIKNSSDEKNIIFDGFMGCGTTITACKNTNRNFFGCEIEEKYFKICESRL